MRNTAATLPITRWVRVAAVFIGALALGQAAHAQTEPRPRINYLFAVNYGFGDYEIEGRSVQVYRVPIGYTLRSLNDHSWGLRLTLPVSFGVHDLKAASDLEDLAGRIETMSVTPGLEGHVPVGENWMLKPFGEAGLGTIFLDSGSSTIYAFGLRARGDYPLHTTLMSVGAAARYDGTTAEYANNDSYTTFELGAELTYPLGFSVSGHAIDMSTFVIFRRFSDLVFETVDGDQLSVDDQWEIACTFGTVNELKILGVRMPRVGIGYRWTGNMQGIRINFGFPF